MAEDFYGGGDEEGSDKGMEGGDKRSDMGETTLVPKAMFEGKDLKPGDEFYFTVVHIYENEVEVSYKHDEKKEKSEGMDSEDTPEKAFDSKFSMMGNEGGGGGY